MGQGHDLEKSAVRVGHITDDFSTNYCSLAGDICSCMGSSGKVNSLPAHLFGYPTLIDIRALEYDELDIVLMELVKYLKHKNPIVSGVAFNEVSETCSYQKYILTQFRY